MQFMMRSMGSSVAMQSSKKGGDLSLLSAMFSGNRELAMKRVFAEQMEQMDGQLQPSLVKMARARSSPSATPRHWKSSSRSLILARNASGSFTERAISNICTKSW